MWPLSLYALQLAFFFLSNNFLLHIILSIFLFCFQASFMRPSSHDYTVGFYHIVGLIFANGSVPAFNAVVAVLFQSKPDNFR